MILTYLLASILLASIANKAAIVNANRNSTQDVPSYVQWAWLIFVLTHWVGGSTMTNTFSGCTVHRRRFVGMVAVAWPVLIGLLAAIGLVCFLRMAFDKLVPQGIRWFDHAPCTCGAVR